MIRPEVIYLPIPARQDLCKLLSSISEKCGFPVVKYPRNARGSRKGRRQKGCVCLSVTFMPKYIP